MSEENADGNVDSQLELRAVDAETLADAKVATLVVTGQKEVMLALADVALAFMLSLGGQIAGAHDLAGNAVDIAPVLIDPLAGDTPDA